MSTKLPGLDQFKSETTPTTQIQATPTTTTNAGTATTTNQLPKFTTSRTGTNPPLPSLTSPSPTGTSVTTSSVTWETPTITPPSAHNNPNVWRSDLPSGLVFIIVGAISLFFFMVFLLFLLVRRLIAKRTAKRSGLEFDSANSSDAGGFGGYYGASHEKLNRFYSNNASSSNLLGTAPSNVGGAGAGYNLQNKIPLLYNEESTQSHSSYDNIGEKETHIFSTLDATNNNLNLLGPTSQPGTIDDLQNKRRSMFLSPTAEVMSFNKKQSHHQRMISSLHTSSVANDSSEGLSEASYPQTYGGSQVGSQAGSQVGSQVGSQGQRGQNRKLRATPSAYLENMFDDDA